MAGWDALAKELSRTVFSVDADVRFRTILLTQQCERLFSICNHIRDPKRTQIEEKSVAKTLAVEQSIQDATKRARRIRTEHAINNDSDEVSSKELPQTGIQSILAIAKATRMAQQSSERVERPPKAPQLTYPHKLKALETQLYHIQEKEREASFRFAFCCTTNEYLSLSHSRRQLVFKQQRNLRLNDKMDVPVACIQVSFPCQVASLQHGYQRLMEFMLTKLKIKSLQVTKTPTLSSVLPMYHRLKQAKRMLRLLNSETKALMERLPTSAPQLSQSTATHRDAILARICKKSSRIHVGTIENGALRDAAPPLLVNKEILDKLQTKWATDALARIASHRSIDFFPTAVREIVLTELSNAVLWSFKTYFTDTAEQPNAGQVKAVMHLVRLVDSVVLSRGRTYRSIVAP